MTGPFKAEISFDESVANPVVIDGVPYHWSGNPPRRRLVVGLFSAVPVVSNYLDEGPYHVYGPGTSPISKWILPEGIELNTPQEAYLACRLLDLAYKEATKHEKARMRSMLGL
jgi:hypothetical protein